MDDLEKRRAENQARAGLAGNGARATQRSELLEKLLGAELYREQRTEAEHPTD